MPRDRLFRARSAAVLGTAVLGTAMLGGVVGTTSSGAAASTVSAAAGRTPATGAVHGVANLVIYSIDSDGADFQAILSGAIGDYGPAVTVLPGGKVDPEHTNEDGVRAPPRDVPSLHRRG